MNGQAILASIQFMQYPDVLLTCENGVQFEASMNERNREKLDAMTDFPELLIEDYNASHGMLKSGDIEAVVHLQRL